MRAPVAIHRTRRRAASRQGPARPCSARRKHRLDPRDQLARTERLHHVVVRADLEADDAVHLGAHGRQHDDRRPVSLAQLLAENKPAIARHHEIEHDEVEPTDLDRVHHLAPVSRLGHPEAMFDKVFADEGAQLAIVVDNQDVTGGPCAQNRAPDGTISGRTVSNAERRGQEEFVTKRFRGWREARFVILCNNRDICEKHRAASPVRQRCLNRSLECHSCRRRPREPRFGSSRFPARAVRP